MLKANGAYSRTPTFPTYPTSASAPLAWSPNVTAAHAPSSTTHSLVLTTTAFAWPPPTPCNSVAPSSASSNISTVRMLAMAQSTFPKWISLMGSTASGSPLATSLSLASSSLPCLVYPNSSPFPWSSPWVGQLRRRTSAPQLKLSPTWPIYPSVWIVINLPTAWIPLLPLQALPSRTLKPPDNYRLPPMSHLPNLNLAADPSATWMYTLTILFSWSKVPHPAVDNIAATSFMPWTGSFARCHPPTHRHDPNPRPSKSF